jgi:hypothetical protein
MTSAGLVLGSPAYIAPEVAAGQPVTPAADLWGLGATLFAAVEGRPPYDVGGDPVKTITEVVDGDVPRARVPGPVGEVIAALMVKEPDARMPLDEVRLRLRPMISDPDDPLFPGSPDAPTLASFVTPSDPSDAAARPSPRPSPVGASASRPVAVLSTGARPSPGGSSAGPAPLAADPGPLPGPPARVTAPPPAAPAPARPAPVRTARPRHPAVLVVAGALVVLLGAALGWSVTRAVGGQSPLGSSTATSPDVDLQARTYPLGFSAGVPSAWTPPFPYEAVEGGERHAAFISPDGTEEFLVRPGPDAGRDAAQLGVDAVTEETVLADGVVRYRTVRGEQERLCFTQQVQDWTVRLTVPGDRDADDAEELFRRLRAGFAPGG